MTSTNEETMPHVKSDASTERPARSEDPLPDALLAGGTFAGVLAASFAKRQLRGGGGPSLRDAAFLGLASIQLADRVIRRAPRENDKALRELPEALRRVVSSRPLLSAATGVVLVAAYVVAPRLVRAICAPLATAQLSNYFQEAIGGSAAPQEPPHDSTVWA